VPLEIGGSVRADCDLSPDSPRPKVAAIGSCNPRSRRPDFGLTLIAALRSRPHLRDTASENVTTVTY
jgi:hypothetical protein